jgi:hypothetical protein
MELSSSIVIPFAVQAIDQPAEYVGPHPLPDGLLPTDLISTDFFVTCKRICLEECSNFRHHSF